MLSSASLNNIGNISISILEKAPTVPIQVIFDNVHENPGAKTQRSQRFTLKKQNQQVFQGQQTSPYKADLDDQVFSELLTSRLSKQSSGAGTQSRNKFNWNLRSNSFSVKLKTIDERDRISKNIQTFDRVTFQNKILQYPTSQLSVQNRDSKSPQQHYGIEDMQTQITPTKVTKLPTLNHPKVKLNPKVDFEKGRLLSSFSKNFHKISKNDMPRKDLAFLDRQKGSHSSNIKRVLFYQQYCGHVESPVSEQQQQFATLYKEIDKEIEDMTPDYRQVRTDDSFLQEYQQQRQSFAMSTFSKYKREGSLNQLSATERETSKDRVPIENNEFFVKFAQKHQRKLESYIDTLFAKKTKEDKEKKKHIPDGFEEQFMTYIKNNNTYRQEHPQAFELKTNPSHKQHILKEKLRFLTPIKLPSDKKTTEQFLNQSDIRRLKVANYGKWYLNPKDYNKKIEKLNSKLEYYMKS